MRMTAIIITTEASVPNIVFQFSLLKIKKCKRKRGIEQRSWSQYLYFAKMLMSTWLYCRYIVYCSY